MTTFEWPGDEQPPAPDRPHTEHPTIGPPGTGKTTWLSRQAQHAAEQYGKDAVVICSLTKAAAAEVAGRDTGIPPEQVGTLHAHAYRALNRPALAETSDGIKAWNDQGNQSMRLTGQRKDPEDTAGIEQPSGTGDADRKLQQLNLLRAKRMPYALWAEDIKHFHHEWTAWKTDTLRLDFTDLIERAIDTIPKMPGDPTVIMIDEAQDLSRLEMTLARQWGQHAEQLITVGDPDQCLYSWRGADPSIVFGDDPDRIRVLSTSYRVPAAVHEVAVEMIQRIPDRLPIVYHPRQPQNGEAVDHGEAISRQGLFYKDPRPVVQLAADEVDAGRTVMLLTTCGYMLYPITAELRRQGVPFHNPYRVTQGAWNPLAGANRLLAYLRPLTDVWGSESRLWTWDDLRRWTEPIQAKGTMSRGSKALIERKCDTDQFGNTRADQVVPLNVMLELFEPNVREALMNLDVDWWHSVLRANEHKRQEFSLAAYQRGGPDALRAKPKVIIGTIHSVKGGEADTVILFPDLSTTGYWEGLKRWGEPRNSIHRLMYVGMTRARHKLVMCGPSDYSCIEW